MKGLVKQMPKFQVMEFMFFFWSNEFVGESVLEPVHIHVCVGKPSSDAPKWWVGNGKIVRADENTNLKAYGIKPSDIKTIEKLITRNTDLIINMWKNHFGADKISFHESVR